MKGPSLLSTRRIRTILIFSPLAILILAVTAETVIRARLWMRDPHVWDADGLFRYAPSLQIGDMPKLTTNNHGFFGPDLAEVKPDGVCRVFLLGSSPITGPDIPDAMTSQLAASLPGSQFEICSTGVPRYASWHVARLFERYVMPLKPDIIVIYFGLNDNVFNVNPGIPEPPPAGLWNWRDLHRSVALDMFLYHAWHKRFRIQPQFTATPASEIYARHVRHLLDLAEKHNIRVILMRKAVAWPPASDKLAATIHANEKPMRHYWGETDAALLGLKANLDELEKLAHEYHITLYDPAPVLPPDETHFIDLCHFTPEGSRAFACFTANLVADIVRGNPKPTFADIL